MGRTFSRGQVAEGEGFEPSVGLHPQRFSRPPRSTAPASLRWRRWRVRRTPGHTQAAVWPALCVSVAGEIAEVPGDPERGRSIHGVRTHIRTVTGPAMAMAAGNGLPPDRGAGDSPPVLFGRAKGLSILWRRLWRSISCRVVHRRWRRINGSTAHPTRPRAGGLSTIGKVPATHPWRGRTRAFDAALPWMAAAVTRCAGNAARRRPARHTPCPRRAAGRPRAPAPRPPPPRNRHRRRFRRG
jgi:hypothetical protein